MLNKYLLSVYGIFTKVFHVLNVKGNLHKLQKFEEILNILLTTVEFRSEKKCPKANKQKEYFQYLKIKQYNSKQYIDKRTKVCEN